MIYEVKLQCHNVRRCTSECTLACVLAALMATYVCEGLNYTVGTRPQAPGGPRFFSRGHCLGPSSLQSVTLRRDTFWGLQKIVAVVLHVLLVAHCNHCTGVAEPRPRPVLRAVPRGGCHASRATAPKFKLTS